MRFTSGVISSALLLLSVQASDAFTISKPVLSSVSSVSSTHPAFISNKNNKYLIYNSNNRYQRTSSSSLRMSATESTTVGTYSVGIVGATGAVGKEIRQCLETRNFPVSTLRIFGSERSAGSIIDTDKYGKITVELFNVDTARQCDVVFLAVSGDFSLQYAKALTDNNGCVVIDNSSAFRYEPDVPLVVPEINGAETKKSKLIANPNCTTAIGLMALWPLHKAFVLKKILMSTYQAASGAGQPGMDELLNGTRDYLDGKDVVNNIFAHPLPFNVIPQIDKFLENGYTKEEMKVVWESRKIMNLADDFPVSCTAVRIPTIRAHSESIVIETEKPITVEGAKAELSNQSGLQLVDNTAQLEYPMPSKATGQYDVQVGRVRQSLVYGDHGLELFVCGDQLLRGAALNAVIIAEVMVQNGSLVPASASPSSKSTETTTAA